MRRLFIVVTVLTAIVGCTQKTYTSRAEAILAEMHNPKSDYVIVACHRGDWRNYPENSIPAIESIIRMGADIMELDIKMTKDSVIVLSHDKDVLRCTNFSKVYKNQPGKSPRICDLTYDEILGLRLKRAHGVAVDTLKMPTLREALLCCKDRICINVDHGFDLYDKVLELTEELGVTNQVLIKSQYTIEHVDSVLSKHENKMMYMPIVKVQNPKGAELFASYMEKGIVPMAYEVVWKHNEDNAFAEACKKIVDQGSKIWVNTIWASLCGGDGNDDDAAFQTGTEVYDQYLEKGVSMIQTDRPELLIKYLQSKGRHSLK